MAPNPRSLATASLLAALIGAVAPAAAEDCVTSGIAVRGEPFTIAAAEANRTSAVWNPDRGEYLVVWNVYAAGEHRLRARRVAADGTPLGDELELAHDTNAIIDPVVATAAGHDRYLVVWQTQNVPFNGARGQLLDGDGSAHGDLFVIGESGAEPALVYGAANEEFLFSGRGMGVWAQRIGVDGALVGDGLDLTTGTDPVAAPNGALAINASGQALALWRDQENDRLVGRRASGGSVVGAIVAYADEFPASGTAARLDYRVADDRYLALYGNFDETAVRWFGVDAAGVGTAPQTVAEGAGLVAAAVAYDDATASAALFWTARGTDIGATLYGQLLSPADTLAGAPLALSDTVSSNLAVAAARERGAALVAWADAEQVRGQRVAYGCLLTDSIFIDGFD
ncbi:hypothetical protein [Dokdonella sp.]|uniref:hypothetical protein n=1 Tax=Dokdonella sp. TaxID=2291710 RepID=UPI001B0CB501|nr:hypothetical protein [Dokdonella sp.]MBO9661571.1 hypothetical protein [Dokdonella sp.]